MTLAGDRSLDAPEPLAIVGMACRFPGAENLDAFWRLLASGSDAITPPPADRVALARRSGGPAAGALPLAGGFLRDIDRFDPEFFGISPREANHLDPQQRLLLELSWEALEDAGIVPARLAGTATGVFVGMWLNDYEDAVYRAVPDVDFYMTTGGGRYAASGRLSYFFDLRGPSLTVDTACSSSLVAVHLACRSLWTHETDTALAAGVNVILEAPISLAYSRAHLLSPRARCRFGDVTADGYVRSEGAGLIVLKRLSRALAEGDRVRAVIVGSATNNDGRGSGLLVTPSAEGQEAMLRQAYRVAGVAPATVQCIEAHGTGTRVGDPIELQALAAVLAEGRRGHDRCAVGSVKSNIGHTESAAGLAGLIKVVLGLEHQTMPVSLHVAEPNPSVPWDTLPLELVRSPRPWPASDRARVAGVSAFGITGTNAHVVLSDVPSIRHDHRRGAVPAGPRPLLLSARSAQALRDVAAAYARELRTVSAPAPAHETFGDICYTAAVRRTHHEHRLAVMADSTATAASALEAYGRAEAHHGVLEAPASRVSVSRVVFVFPGQGAQWAGMARTLLAHEAVFSAALTRCADAVQALVGWSVIELVHADEARWRQAPIDEVQPALFCVQVALAALWRSWGVEPAAVVGHSMGEVAAAHVAGVLSLDDAVRIICGRSAQLRRTSGQGAMAVVELSARDAGHAVAAHADRLSVAACNGTRSTVIAGDPVALDDLLAALEARGVFCRRVNVDVASHSPQMEPLRDDLLTVLSGIAPQAARVPLWSTVTGHVAEGHHLDEHYWWRNLRQPVLFADTIGALVAEGHTTYVELSPHPLLLDDIRELTHEHGCQGLALPSGRRQEDERAVMLASAAALHCAGGHVEWARTFEDGRVVSLPSYPWQRASYWFHASERGADIAPDAGLLRGPIESSVHRETTFWESELSVERLPYLSDHRVRGAAWLPAAAFVEMALTAARARFGGGAVGVANVEFREALSLGAPRMTQLVSRPAQPGWNGEAGEWTFSILSRPTEGGEWTLHATGKFGSANDAAAAPYALATLTGTMCRPTHAVDHGGRMQERGLEYGPAFRSVAELWGAPGAALARLELAPTAPATGHQVAPSLLDACFQTLVATCVAEPSTPYVPIGIETVQLLRPAPTTGWAYAVRRHEDSGPAHRDAEGDVVLFDEAGAVVLMAGGLRLRRMAGGAAADIDRIVLERRWETADAAPIARRMSGRWLVVAPDARRASDVAGALQALGAECTSLCGAAPAQGGIGPRHVDLAQPGEVARMVAAAGPCDGVVAVWTAESDPAGAATRMSVEVMHLAQALTGTGQPSPPRLWLVTCGAQQVTDVDIVGPDVAALWGLGAVLAHEHPELRCVRVDVDAAGLANPGDALAREIAANGPDDQVVIRSGQRHVARLCEGEGLGSGVALADEGTPFHTTMRRPGVLDSLTRCARPRVAPRDGEVEIEVRATGLNFLNVLAALGAHPATPDGSGPLGLECAGTVCAVGRGVTHVSVGDEVVAITPDALSSHAIADGRLVVRAPANVDLVRAATLPIVFATAIQALERLANLQPGERTLIHAATGGVGLAAIQIAQRRGADIFATAGTPHKRAYLDALGVSRAFDSRSTRFAHDVLDATGGEGVDVVLNCLTGEAVAAGLSTLRGYGRFVEIGKRDIYDNTPVGLWPFRKNLSYMALDIDAMRIERPAVLGTLLQEVVTRIDAGHLAPLPVDTYAAENVADAFHQMARAHHIGKLAITTKSRDGHSPRVEASSRLRAEGAYLITGGLGGLGLTVARWMVEHGARHVHLLGRQRPSPAHEHALEALRRTGATITTIAADVGRVEDVDRALRDIADTGRVLRGIVHAAGMLDDGFLEQQNQARVSAVMAAKVYGAWHLHERTAALPLDFFVLFSSVAALLGTPGQGGYAAANAFLDGLAHRRRAAGQPALSINWGPWAEVGLATAADRAARLHSQGLRALAPAEALAAFALALGSDKTQVTIAAFDVSQWLATHPVDNAGGFFSGSRPLPRTRGTSSATAPRLIDALRDTARAGDRRRTLETFVREQAAQVLRLPPDRVDARRPLRELGFDSLMTLELRNRLEAALGTRLPATLVWNYPTVADLVPHLAQRAGVSLDAHDAPRAHDSQPLAPGDEAVARLTRDEVTALLSAELDELDDLLRGS